MSYRQYKFRVQVQAPESRAVKLYYSECGPKLLVLCQDVAVRIILHYSYNITEMVQFCAQSV